MFTVTLELPECEGNNPLEAVEDFQLMARQEHLFVYRVTDDSTGKSFAVDMADETIIEQEDG